MRIIAGKYRGKQINAPSNLPVRPTTDFAKEALFNLVNNHYNLDQISVLDLFAGTGNISYELASRGCADITAVDLHPVCIKFINQTVEKLDLKEIHVVRSDAFTFVKRAYRKWDLIFADPPFDIGRHAEIVDQVFASNRLEENGMLIVEHPKEVDLSAHPNFTESRKYGHIHFSFFE